jgi:hypothetical protein
MLSQSQSLKIALIGPGIIPIPPTGHGAVEILIWDYYLELTKQGNQVDIINIIRNSHTDQSSPYTSYCNYLIQIINSGNYDFVHLHYDCLYHILPFLTCSKIGITSHYPYIDNFEKHVSDGFSQIFSEICNITNKQYRIGQNYYIFAISNKDINAFINMGIANKERVFLLLNGANHREIKHVHFLEKQNRSLISGRTFERTHSLPRMRMLTYAGLC